MALFDCCFVFDCLDCSLLVVLDAEDSAAVCGRSFVRWRVLHSPSHCALLCQARVYHRSCRRYVFLATAITRQYRQRADILSWFHDHEIFMCNTIGFIAFIVLRDDKPCLALYSTYVYRIDFEEFISQSLRTC